MSGAGDRLWDAITAAYARPGIAPLCLRLQADGDIDVVLLLTLCHASATGSPLPVSAVDRLRADVAPWRSRAILPLRRLRMDLRQPVAGIDPERQESVRTRIKALELQAERLQVDLLADALAREAEVPDPDALAAVNHVLGGTPITRAEHQALRTAFGG